MAKKKVQASRDEIARRVDKIYTILVRGVYDNSKIFELAKQEGWSVSERQIYNYINRARKLLEEQADVKREYEFGRSLARLNDLYNKALALLDFRACVTIQKEINKLYSFYD